MIKKTISFSDILSDYIAFCDDYIIEFIAKSLFKKNNIYLYKYKVNENIKSFYNTPFWKAEWRAKEVSFNYNDINQVYFLTPPLFTLFEFFKKMNIKYKEIKEKDLSTFPEEFFIKKFKKKIRREYAQI